MAKKYRKLLAAVLAAAMTTGILCTPALALDGTVDITNPDGTVTVQTTVTDNSTDADGNDIETVTVTKTTDDTTDDGVKITANETRVDTTVTNDKGNVLATSTSIVGCGKKEWTSAISPAARGIPMLEITLVPGETAEIASSGSASFSDGDTSDPDDETDLEYNYSDTSVDYSRKITVTTADVILTRNEISHTALRSVFPEAYEGKKFIEIVNDYIHPAANMLKHFHKNTAADENGTEEVLYYPIVSRTQEEYDLLPDAVKAQYDAPAEEGGLYTPKDAENALQTLDNGKNWDVIFSNFAEYTMSGSVRLVRGNSYKDQGVSLICLHDKFGNRFYAYCMDAEKGAAPGAMYTIENIEDEDYIPGTPEEKEDALAHILAAAYKGYWGTESGLGSITDLRQGVKDALNAGMPVDFSFMGRVDGVNDSVEFNYNSTDDLDKLLALADTITEGEALTATQGAIWLYANHKANTVDSMHFGVIRTYTLLDGTYLVYNGDSWEGTQEEYDEENRNVEARMELVKAYLTSDYLKDLVAQETAPTEIITADKFLDEDTITLTIGEKIDGLAENLDDIDDNDVYSVDISFGLEVPVSEKDELEIILTDAEGNVLSNGHIGKNQSENGEDFTAANDVYTFMDIPLAENSELVLKFSLDGAQHLEKGVYMYKSTEGSATEQTLISIAEGAKAVSVAAEFSLTLDIEEEQSVTEISRWRSYREEKLADPDLPSTGDSFTVFPLLIALLGVSLAGIVLLIKRKA